MRERLEDVLRSNDLADDLVMLLRGGVYDEDVNRLQRQAADLDRRFNDLGGPSFGVSVFRQRP